MLKFSGTTQITRDDSKRIFDAFRSLNGTTITVGVHSDVAPYADGHQPPVATVAARNEFGHSTDGPVVPARPFMRPALAAEQNAVANGIVTAVARFVTDKVPLMRGFSAAAELLINAIQVNILSDTGPALSGSWEPPRGYLGFKRLKGYPQQTLIATYTMLSSIGFKVRSATGNVEAQGQGQGKHTGDAS